MKLAKGFGLGTSAAFAGSEPVGAAGVGAAKPLNAEAGAKAEADAFNVGFSVGADEEVATPNGLLAGGCCFVKLTAGG